MEALSASLESAISRLLEGILKPAQRLEWRAWSRLIMNTQSLLFYLIIPVVSPGRNAQYIPFDQLLNQ